MKFYVHIDISNECVFVVVVKWYITSLYMYVHYLLNYQYIQVEFKIYD